METALTKCLECGEEFRSDNDCADCCSDCCDHDWDLEERACLNCGKPDEDWVSRVFKHND